MDDDRESGSIRSSQLTALTIMDPAGGVFLFNNSSWTGPGVMGEKLSPLNCLQLFPSWVYITPTTSSHRSLFFECSAENVRCCCTTLTNTYIIDNDRPEKSITLRYTQTTKKKVDQHLTHRLFKHWGGTREWYKYIEREYKAVRRFFLIEVRTHRSCVGTSENPSGVVM